MKTSTAVALVVGAVAVVGIAAKVFVDAKIRAFSTIVPKSAPSGSPVACDRITANTCELDVTVSVTGDACTVSTKDYVKLGAKDDVKRIEWKLPSGFTSCPRAGDGAFFDKADIGDDQFEIDVHGKCSRTIGWKRKDKDDKDYAYMLRFRNDGNTLYCAKDPWFKNG